MTLQELLNTDLTTLGGWLGEGWRWWIGELAGMAPGPVRRWLEPRPSLVAEPLADGGYRLSRDGRQVMAEARGRRAVPVSLLLPRELALVRQVAAPAIAARDVRRMLALDIDRLTPFRAEQVFVDVVPGGPGAQHALVAALPREVAIEAMQHARAAGLEPRAIGLAGAVGDEAAADFLPAMRAAGAVAGPSRGYRLVWAAVAVLALVNLAAAIGRDVWDVQALRARIEAQRPAVSAAAQLRGKVLVEARRREDILGRRAAGDPLAMLDALTRATPGGAWVDRLAFDGRSVRVSGFRQEAVDVAAALRASPRLTNVRNSGGDLLTRQAAGQPFDLTADLRPGAGR